MAIEWRPAVTVMSRPDPTLLAAHEAIRQGSRSFALASRLFDGPTRDRATLLYAWCRHCDDVIDNQWLGEGHHDWGGADDAGGYGDTPVERLERLRAFSDRALAGDPTGGPPFAALARVASEVALPAGYVHDLLDGFAMDVDWRPIADEGQLLRYCYHVAGCVGVMMAIVMGVPADDDPTLLRASDLGLSFQLNNIARDIAEDAGRGRCYLPADWLAEAGLTIESHADDHNRDRLHQVASRLVDLAECYEHSAIGGVTHLRNRQAWAVLSAAQIYGGIGRKVRSHGPEALAGRVRTRRRDKLFAVAAAAPAALLRRMLYSGNVADRHGLWTPVLHHPTVAFVQQP